MPAYNTEMYISKAIESVLNQTYNHIELLIIDDSSVDNTLHVINEYKANDNRIKTHINNKNMGASYCRNVGIKASKGRYIAFIDSDDIWDFNKIKSQLSFMNNYLLDFCFTSYSVIKNDEVHHSNRYVTDKFVSYSSLLRFNEIGCSTVIIDKQNINFDIFFPSLKKRNDYAFWLILFKNNLNLRAKGFNKVLVTYRLRNNSLSSKKYTLPYYYFSVYRDILGYSIYMSFFLVIRFILNFLKNNLPMRFKSRLWHSILKQRV